MAFKEKTSSKKDKVISTILIIIIVLALLSVGVVYLLNGRFFKNTEGVTSQGGGKLSSNLVTPDEIKDKTANFLICGIDYLEGSNRGKLTDTIMFVSFDIDGKNVDVLQIPRDSYIGDDYPTGKINAIYGQSKNGGVDGLAKRINQTLGLTIDHYVTIDMDGFVEIVDKIGGVEVDVPQSIDLEGVHIEKGLQTLDGRKAEKFVRERHSYANGDLGRIEMQKVFMSALVKKVFSMGKSSVLSLAPSLINYVTTDMSLNEMLGYYTSLMGLDKTSGINFHTLPVEGGTYRGLSVLKIKRQETADLLNEFFRPHSEPVAAADLGILDLTFDAPKAPQSSQPAQPTESEPVVSEETPPEASDEIPSDTSSDEIIPPEDEFITSDDDQTKQITSDDGAQTDGISGGDEILVF